MSHTNADQPQADQAKAHSFDALTPDAILSAVESLGIATDGRLLALNSYENRVYRVGVDDDTPQVVKFYRAARWSDEQIREEHSFAIALADAEIPVVPPLTINGNTLHTYSPAAQTAFRFALFPMRGGRAPELDQAEVREWIGRFLGRIHALGAVNAFAHRPTLNADTFGEMPARWLDEHQTIPHDLRDAWASVVRLALDGVRQCYDCAGDVPLIRLHGDCHIGNILYTEEGPHFVDFDDARMGPAIQDLWMLLSGTREEMTVQLRDVLEGYAEFADFDPRELHLLEALRTLRMIHYAYWLAQRADDPAFPIAFPWFFGSQAERYWQNLILHLREQVALMQEPPLQLLPP